MTTYLLNGLAGASHSALLEDFQVDPGSGVLVPDSGLTAFRYSDGDEVEDRILNVIRRATDISTASLELQEGATDFPSRYHLSVERANLLRPIQTLMRGRVLEIGAGCGALTRFLGETGSEIWAVEGSFKRASICRERCRDLPNVHVVCSHARAFRPKLKFEMILLIGVLEYSRTYFEHPDGPAMLLQMCRELLAPNGVLVVAIENQLGLKYLAGAPEDHLSVPYVGVHGQYGPKTQVVFGRRELEGLLKGAGFLNSQFLYPFPDYKFPRIVFPAAALKRFDANIATLLRLSPAQDQNIGYSRVFSEEMAWPVVLRNQMAEDLSNSFLVLASPSASAGFGAFPVSIYSAVRKKCFAKVVEFNVESPEDGVRSSYLYNVLRETGSFRHRIRRETLYRDPLYGECFIDVLNHAGWVEQDLAGCALPWLDHLREHAMAVAGGDGFSLPGDFVDRTPFNLVRTTDGGWHAFDQEWISAARVPLEFVLFRGLLDPLLRVQSVAPPGPLRSTLVLDIVADVFRWLGLEQSKSRMDELLDMEAALHDFALGNGCAIREFYPQLRIRPARPDLLRHADDCERPLAKGSETEGLPGSLQSTMAAELARVADLESAVERNRAEKDAAKAYSSDLAAQLETARKNTDRLHGELMHVLQSKTWRWGSKLAKVWAAVSGV